MMSTVSHWHVVIRFSTDNNHLTVKLWTARWDGTRCYESREALRADAVQLHFFRAQYHLVHGVLDPVPKTTTERETGSWRARLSYIKKSKHQMSTNA